MIYERIEKACPFKNIYDFIGHSSTHLNSRGLSTTN